jgi:transposase
MVETVREGDADRRVEAIPRRRRDWTAEQKARIVAESSQRGANISEVARRHEVDLRLLGVWRRQARVLMVPAAPAPLFAAAQIEDGTAVQGASVATAREADAMLEDMLEDMHEGDAHRRVEVITRRRPDWTVEQKARIVVESFQSGANIPEVARLNGIDRGLLGVWRRQARAPPMSPPPAPLFGAVQI